MNAIIGGIESEAIRVTVATAATSAAWNAGSGTSRWKTLLS
jgi:hypothetical protein